MIIDGCNVFLLNKNTDNIIKQIQFLGKDSLKTACIAFLLLNTTKANKEPKVISQILLGKIKKFSWNY